MTKPSLHYNGQELHPGDMVQVTISGTVTPDGPIRTSMGGSEVGLSWLTLAGAALTVTLSRSPDADGPPHSAG